MARLTDDEVQFLHDTEVLNAAVWKIVAKDHECDWSDYRRVPYWTRLEDLQCTLHRYEARNA